MAVCSIHRYHWPKALTDESHHVIPQAWQRFAEASRAGAPLQTAAQLALDASSYALWDRETVELCPTGHRNVHAWIVRLMKATPVAPSPELVDFADNPVAAKLAVFGLRRLTREQTIAYEALTRFASSARPGGTGLEDLRIAKLWGQG